MKDVSSCSSGAIKINIAVELLSHMKNIITRFWKHALILIKILIWKGREKKIKFERHALFVWLEPDHLLRIKKAHRDRERELVTPPRLHMSVLDHPEVNYTRFVGAKTQLSLVFIIFSWCYSSRPRCKQLSTKFPWNATHNRTSVTSMVIVINTIWHKNKW